MVTGYRDGHISAYNRVQFFLPDVKSNMSTLCCYTGPRAGTILSEIQAIRRGRVPKYEGNYSIVSKLTH